MHAYNRIPSSGVSTPSPPQSPIRSPRLRYGSASGRSKSGRHQLASLQPRSLLQRFALGVLALVLRRQGIFLFAPLIYISGMLLYMGTVSLDVVPTVISRPQSGSIYRSPQLYAKLRRDMDADNASLGLETVWKQPYKGGEWKPCVNQSSEEAFTVVASFSKTLTQALLQSGITASPESNGYMYIEANGGLNQQRASIGNAVAVAAYLNATLLIPNFNYHSIWRDTSKFGDIFDEEYFINTLKNDVRVVNKLPDYIMERFDHNMSNVYNFKVKAWSPIKYYKDTVLPKLIEDRAQGALSVDNEDILIIRISPFANRLSFDAPPAVQRLRCLANYEALRMKERSVNNNAKYIAVHLRFEEDMVAFSCCVFDSGEEEKHDMDAARERGWRGKFTKPGRVIRPGANRINGKCPLTPLEVGLMLRGMGFANDTSIYLASGKIYKSEKNMVPLLEMFPLLQTKETLASAEELDQFMNHSSRMAAIDYTVCLHSEVFVTTQGGNFPQLLIGHRRYLNGGHSKTIRPDKRKLAVLFDNPKIGPDKGISLNLYSPLCSGQSLVMVTALCMQRNCAVGKVSPGFQFGLETLLLSFRWKSFKRQMKMPDPWLLHDICFNGDILGLFLYPILGASRPNFELVSFFHFDSGGCLLEFQAYQQEASTVAGIRRALTEILAVYQQPMYLTFAQIPSLFGAISFGRACS
ncbi:Protein ESMERALDA 1 [Asimina triloba]